MIYTLLIVSKRYQSFRNERRNAPALWDIVQSKECNTPSAMSKFLRNNNLFFRGSPYGDTLKVEVHEGAYNQVNWSRQPMIIKSIIPKGSRTYRPCIHFMNGNIQDLSKFLNHWKMQHNVSVPA